MATDMVDNDIDEIWRRIKEGAVKWLFPKQGQTSVSTIRVHCKARIEIKLATNVFNTRRMSEGLKKKKNFNIVCSNKIREGWNYLQVAQTLIILAKKIHNPRQP